MWKFLKLSANNETLRKEILAEKSPQKCQTSATTEFPAARDIKKDRNPGDFPAAFGEALQNVDWSVEKHLRVENFSRQ